MESKAKYLQRLQKAVEELHGCTARHAESVRIRETFRSEISWQGTVEVFDLTGHAEAKRAYCWSHLQGRYDSTEDFVAVLAIPPINSPLDAVRATIIRDVKKGKR